MNEPANKRGTRALARLNQLQPPAWITEMRKYYLEHGAFRPEDVARLTGDRARSPRTLAHSSGTAANLLQQMARKLTK